MPAARFLPIVTFADPSTVSPKPRPRRRLARHYRSVEPVDRFIRRSGYFQRRRDLLALGYRDWHLKVALGAKRIFRVRQGWYSVPDAPEPAIRAVRVGGQLTGVAALESYGFRVPRRPRVDIQVASNACRLRQPTDRRARFSRDSGVRVTWSGERRLSRADPLAWRASVDDALVFVLKTERRDVAVACASAVAHKLRWGSRRIATVFARASASARCWASLVDARDESHGETFVRLWLADAAIRLHPQVHVPGVGRVDGQVAPHVFIEVDGAQHDPEWTGDGGSSYHSDIDRDIRLAIRSSEAIRITYRQLDRHRGGVRWAECLAAIRQAIANDLELVERRARHPVPRRFRGPVRKRRSTGVLDRSNAPP